MSRILDRFAILATLLMLLLMWQESEAQEGGASPEFIRRVTAETEEGFKELSINRQSKRSAARLGVN